MGSGTVGRRQAAASTRPCQSGELLACGSSDADGRLIAAAASEGAADCRRLQIADCRRAAEESIAREWVERRRDRQVFALVIDTNPLFSSPWARYQTGQLGRPARFDMLHYSYLCSSLLARARAPLLCIHSGRWWRSLGHEPLHLCTSAPLPQRLPLVVGPLTATHRPSAVISHSPHPLALSVAEGGAQAGAKSSH